MAKVRLFANLREIAGAAEVTTDAETVGVALDELSEAFGDEFRMSLETARAWVNGDPAEPSSPLTAGDELALIPPVSGGAEVLTLTPSGLATALAATVVIAANVWGDSAWFAASIIAVGAVWAADLAAESRDGALRLPAVLLTLLVSVVSAFAFAIRGNEFEGFGVVAALAAMTPFLWALLARFDRDLLSLSVSTAGAFVLGAAGGSLVLVRALPAGPDRVTAFLVMVVVGGLATWAASRATVVLLDPFSAGALATILAAVGAAWRLDLSIVDFLLIGVGIAVGQIAGRGFGALCRTGEVYAVDEPPGRFVSLDGAVVAAGLLLPLVWVIGL